MEQFEILNISCTKKEKLDPSLRIIIQYKDEIVSFRFSLNSEQKWFFKGNAYLLESLTDEGMRYHFENLSFISRNENWGNFYETAYDLAPKILNDPKVRIKAILHK